MNLGKIPHPLARRAHAVLAWIDLGCAERALEKIEPFLESPASRPLGLKLRVAALIELKRFEPALEALRQLAPHEHDLTWFDVTEAWCRKRTDDLDGAIACMERLVDRQRHSAIGHFNLGCYLALRGDRERALDELSVACGIDDQFRKLLPVEHDLDSLRDEPQFQMLLPPG